MPRFRFTPRGPITSTPSVEAHKQVRDKTHPDCVACSPARFGLQLQFRLEADGSVACEFPCSRLYQGYPDMLHGGISSLLLDAAMTNCLFMHGRKAVTAELTLRYTAPVSIDQTARVQALLVQESNLLFILQGAISQGGQVKVTALGKFIPGPRVP